MGRAATASKDFPEGEPDGRGILSAAGREWEFQHVSIGNPQCAIVVGEELERLDLAAVGPEIEGHRAFPNRTNVSFLRIDGSRVRARIFERGVGETLSSGTGASGAAVTAVLRGAQSPLTVELDGGELEVEVSEDLGVRLTGWAEPICAGELSPELVAALGRAGSIDSRARGNRRPVKTPGGDASVHVPGARAADRRQARRRHRRDQPRHRRSGRADLHAHRQRDAGGGRRSRHAPVPEQPRPGGVPRGLRPLLRAPLRGRDRPRERGDPGARRQGVHLQPLLRLPRPGGRRARLRPRLSRLHRRPDPRRGDAGAACRWSPSWASRPT